MAKSRLKLLLVVPAIVWAAYGLQHALGSFTIADSFTGARWLAIGCLLALGSVLGGILSPRLAIVSLAILAVSGVGATKLRSHRLAAGIRQLEATYRDVAARGQPFPQTISRAAYENPAFLHWYYQRNSERSFAIVYIASSNGWAMEYPKGTWRFISYKPNGYEPDEPAAADVHAPTRQPATGTGPTSGPEVPPPPE